MDDVGYCAFRFGFYIDLYAHDKGYRKDLRPAFEYLVKLWLAEKGYKVHSITFDEDFARQMTICGVKIEMTQKEYFYLQLSGKAEELNTEIEKHITASLQRLFADNYYA
jgi:hypothetical protein